MPSAFSPLSTPLGNVLEPPLKIATLHLSIEFEMRLGYKRVVYSALSLHRFPCCTYTVDSRNGPRST